MYFFRCDYLIELLQGAIDPLILQTLQQGPRYDYCIGDGGHLNQPELSAIAEIELVIRVMRYLETLVRGLI